MRNNQKTRIVLENGLVVVSEKININEAYTSIGINAGSRDESLRKNGLAHVVEHMFFRTNKNALTQEFQQAFESQGLDYNAMTNFTNTIYFVESRKKQIPYVVDLLFKGLSDNHFDKIEFETEKSSIISELRTYHRHALDRFFERIMWPAIYKGTPLEKSIIGTVESIKNLKLNDLKKFTNEFYVPNNMVITCTGNLDSLIFNECIEKTFGQLKSQEISKKDYDWKLEPRTEYVEFQDLQDYEDRNLDQSFFYLVYPIFNFKSEDFPTAVLLETILGGGNRINFTGKLVDELRVKRGFCYHVDINLETDQYPPLLILGVPDIHPQNLENAIDILQESITDLTSHNVDKTFFLGKINQTAARYSNSTYYTDDLVSNLIKEEFNELPIDHKNMKSRIKHISRQTLRDFAQRVFNNEPLIVVASAPGYKNRFNS